MILHPLKSSPLVRIHSECLTGDVFGSQRCDCHDQLHKSLDLIAQEKSGIIIYLRQEGRGIGLFNKIKAYHLQDLGDDTVDANIKLGFKADERDYEVAGQILESLKVKTVRLLSNNSDKAKALTKQGIHVGEQVPLVIAGPHNSSYLKTKKDKLGHNISTKQNKSQDFS